MEPWMDMLGEVASFLFRCVVAGLWIGFWAISGRTSKEDAKAMNPWTLAVIVTTGFASIMALNLGTVRVDEDDQDPIRGMAQYDQEYEPSAQEQLIEGVRQFLSLFPLACFGIWFGLNKLPERSMEERRRDRQSMSKYGP
jgi:hypothetical protein